MQNHSHSCIMPNHFLVCQEMKIFSICPFTCIVLHFIFILPYLPQEAKMSDFPFGPAPEPGSNIVAELVIERGPSPEQRLPVTAVASTMGRSPNNEIVINDPEISRRHAQILQQAAGFAVEDLGSTNGTFVNGQRCVGVTAVRDGDIIELGDTVRLRFVQMGAIRLHTEDDEDTADLMPVQPPARPTPASNYAAPAPPPLVSPSADYPLAEGRSNRMLIGCVAGMLLLVCLCLILVLFLESYNQGQYLYCGGLRPFWETVLGPFGFNPICP
jgi:hypothetical protein